MAEFWSQCVGFLSNLWSQFISLVSSFSISSMLDVLLISFIIFSFIKLVRETRAEQLVKGIFLLLGVWLVANVLQLRMMQSILNYFFNFSVIALLVVFQPEVRRALEQMGRSNLGRNLGLLSAKEEEDLEAQKRRCIVAVSDAAASLQKSRTGALMVFERQTKLGDIIDTGTVVDAIPSPPIIGNIFFNKAPLHDGAMVLRDGMVYAAGCILPLTKSDNVSIDLGTRHPRRHRHERELRRRDCGCFGGNGADFHCLQRRADAQLYKGYPEGCTGGLPAQGGARASPAPDPFDQKGEKA